MSEDATTWGEMREKIVGAFAGQVPYDESDEHKIVDAWQRNPRRIEVEVERLAQRQAVGQVTFPWRVLAKIAPEVRAPVDARAVADPGAERSRSVRRFDAWLRNAGLHYDRWEEVASEVFGPRGLLRHWAADDDLVEYVRHAWQEHQEVGLYLEEESGRRGEQYRRAVERQREQTQAEVIARASR